MNIKITRPLKKVRSELLYQLTSLQRLYQFNPLLPSEHRSARIAKISFLKLEETIKKLSYGCRSWLLVGRRKEPILRLCL